MLLQDVLLEKEYDRLTGQKGETGLSKVVKKLTLILISWTYVLHRFRIITQLH